MQSFPIFNDLLTALKALPGVGPRTAQRHALHLLQKNPQGAEQLAQAILTALRHVRHCQRCRTLCQEELCVICRSSKRNQQQLCIVESSTDVMAIEQTQAFSGRYFVLMGNLSPLDGIGPEQLGLGILEQQLIQAPPKEIILATGTTVEGEATAHYLATLANRHQIPVTRIAHGVPLGGELEYIDRNTLFHAFNGRHHY